MSIHFGVTKNELIELVSSYQQMENPEHLARLSERGDCSEWLLPALATDHRTGIADSDLSLRARRACFGSNQKEPKKPPGFFALFIEALDDFVLKILMVCAVLSIGLQVGLAAPKDRSLAWIEGFAILAAVFVCATVTAGNNYQKERQFIELNSVADSKKRVTVWRGGALAELHQDLVLVGDVVAVSEGMEVPADGLLLESNDITTDESAMTGETDPQVKNLLSVCTKKRSLNSLVSESQLDSKPVHASPILMSGTRVLTGCGKMVVVVVGAESCLGKIRGILEQEEDDEGTPLQQKLEVIAEDIGKFGLYSAIFVIAVLVIRFTVVKITQTPWDTETDIVKLLDYVIIGIVVIVVAVPEGLPLAVTLSLAFSVKKMLKDQNLVRRLEACETMGGANNICSDKTGTLTMNKMVLTEVWNGKTTRIDAYAERLAPESLSPNPDFLELFKIATLVNSSALLLPEEKGSSTEIALLKFFGKMGVDYEQQRAKYPTKMQLPFSSARKRMSIILEIRGESYLFIKGASEIVLKSCQSWLNAQSTQVEPLDGVREQIGETINAMAGNSLRTLCLAFKKLAADQDLSQKNRRGVYNVEKENLVLLAVIGVRDNPRQEVPEAIKKCHLAGITVRMVTGDNIVTAKAIAKEIGLIKEGSSYTAIEGPDFSNQVGGVVCKNCRTPKCDCPVTKEKAEELKKEMRVDTVANGQAFDRIAENLLVLARSRPEDKYCLVTGLKERGNVVAVTGDGTNDAPALKKADVGFAMGQSGTEVAREAAAIILIDDNFSSIVKAVLWGRNIYDSIRKFIQFQLTVNVVAVFITMVGAALLEREVIKTIQMLWINLIMDTLASLALATEDPHENVLLRKPYSRDDYIVSKSMKKNIVGQSLYQIAVLIVLIFFGERFIPEEQDVLDSQEIYINNPQYKWYNGEVGGTVCSGRFYTISGENDYYTAYDATHNFSRHFTFIFNVFVLMQVFNFVNARKIHEEVNVFKGITKHTLFCLIIVGIFVLQVIIVTFGGFVFGVYPEYGLTVKQWLLSIAFGAGSLVVGLLLKAIPFGEEKPREEVDPVVREAGDVYKKLLEED